MAEHDHHGGGGLHGGRHSDELAKDHLPGVTPFQYSQLLLPEHFDVENRGRSGGGGDFVEGESFALRVGTGFRPKNNDWQSHKEAVLQNNATFDPKHYEFDKRIVAAAGIKGLFDPSDSRYKNFDYARLNLAVMRNYLIDHFFPDRPNLSTSDYRKSEAHLNEIGETIGKMLHNSSRLIPNPLEISMRPSVLNDEGIGGAKLYKKLLEQQKSNEFLPYPIRAIYHLITGKPDWDWNLARIEETPFAQRNLMPRAPLPTTAHLPPIVPVAATAALLSPAALHAIAEQLADTGQVHHQVDHLTYAVKRRAIDHARDILDKLKVTYADTPVAKLLDSDPAQAHALFADVNELSVIFKDHLARASELNPDLLKDSDVKAASNAFGIFSHQAQLFALDSTERQGHTAEAAKILQEMREMPAEWQHPGALRVSDLLKTIDRAYGKVLAQLQEVAQSTSDGGSLGRQDGQGLGGEPGMLEAGAVAAGAVAMAGQGDAGRQNQLRAQQLSAIDHANERRQATKESSHTTPPAATAPTGTTRSTKPAKAARTTPKPGTVQPNAAAQAATMGNLLDSAAIAQMRSGFQSDRMTGEAINPGSRSKAAGVASSSDRSGTVKSAEGRDDNPNKPKVPGRG